MAEEIATKLARLRSWMGDTGLDAAVLRTTANAAWVSGGGRTHVLAMQDLGLADIVVTPDAVRVVTTVNEVDRLMTEELAGLDAEVDVVGWDADRRELLPTGPRVGWDALDAGVGAVDISDAVRRMRRPLVPAEVERVRSLGADTATAVTRVASLVQPDWSEHGIAAAVAGELVALGVDPVVLLVAGRPRLASHRHPLPTETLVGDRLMIVVCARRGGLIASLTRMVSFGPLDARSGEAYARLLDVDVAFNAATRPGTTVGDVFTAGISAYGEHGFAADEWRRHHQGGPAGYQPRDEIGTSASRTPVVAGDLFAWNPSVPGLKAEDTVLTTQGIPQIVTVDPDWPTREVGGLRRPVVLER